MVQSLVVLACTASRSLTKSFTMVTYHVGTYLPVTILPYEPLLATDVALQHFFTLHFPQTTSSRPSIRVG